MDTVVKYISIGLGSVICLLLVVIGNIGFDGILSWLAFKKTVKAMRPIAELSGAAKSHNIYENFSWSIRYTWSDGHCIILVGSNYGFNIHTYVADKDLSIFSSEFNMLFAAARNLQEKIDSKKIEHKAK